MHDDIESYCVTQALYGKESSFFTKGGKDYAAYKLNSIFLYKKAVIISNEWFLLHVNTRFEKKVINYLIKSGIPKEDISSTDDAVCTKIYVIQHPSKFIPSLMKFEKMIEIKTT